MTELIDCDTLSKGSFSETLIIVGETLGGDAIESEPIGDPGIDQLVKKN